ncbi:hypothetical protein ACDX78_19890 [Virgibacillus oceani]
MYFFKPISDNVRFFQPIFSSYKYTMKLMLVAMFACFASILQAAGGFLPGIGFFISPFATAPILLGAMLSLSFGGMAYLLTIMLLFILEPTELIIFPFTTGLLGLGIGASFHFFRKRISVVAAGSVLLTLGIMSVLFILRFPILGPVSADSFSLLATASILLFTFLYSWLWLEIALHIFNRIKGIMQGGLDNQDR